MVSIKLLRHWQDCTATETRITLMFARSLMKSWNRSSLRRQKLSSLTVNCSAMYHCARGSCWLWVSKACNSGSVSMLSFTMLRISSSQLVWLALFRHSLPPASMVSLLWSLLSRLLSSLTSGAVVRLCSVAAWAWLFPWCSQAFCWKVRHRPFWRWWHD